MAKELINLGTAVDTGTGDYLRQGGKKINGNFDEIYGAFGDGHRLQPSIFPNREFSVMLDGSTLSAELGQIYAINTTGGICNVYLPNVTDSDIGRSVTFIDPYGTWDQNKVRFHSTGSASFGISMEKEVGIRYSKVVMTFAAPAMWLYTPGQRIDEFSGSTDSSRYSHYEIVVNDGETDFTDIFPVKYNDAALDVYLNGVELFYGNRYSDESEYGSVDASSASGILPLDGYSIRIKTPLKKGDVVKFVTYTRSVGISPTAVDRFNFALIPLDSNITPIPGEVLSRDFTEDYIDIDLTEIGGNDLSVLNDISTDVYLNGRRLVRRGESGYPEGECSLEQYMDMTTCQNSGGVWTQVYKEYDLIMVDGEVTRLRISTDGLLDGPDDRNFIAIETFNHLIGSVTPVDTIIGETDLRYLRITEPFNRKNKIRYTDVTRPLNSTMVDVPGTETVRLDTLGRLLETVYPVGSLYINAHNPANPADYMGFGTWARYSEGRAVVGWDSRTDALGQYDPDFGLNNNDMSESNSPKPSAGATRGSKSQSIRSANLPKTSIIGRWLQKASDLNGYFKNFGDLGGSNVNPLSSYNESVIEIGQEDPAGVNIIQPSITVYIWVRTA